VDVKGSWVKVRGRFAARVGEFSYEIEKCGSRLLVRKVCNDVGFYYDIGELEKILGME
jgi:hypothetical protein